MKGLGKILRRYAASAVGIGVLLAIFNILVLLIFIITIGNNAPAVEDRVRTIAEGIIQEADGNFSLTEAAQSALDERYVWAMQLNENGDVIWQDRLPEDFEAHYTASQIAAFSRWYLHDYPVYVWQNDYGLLVLASPIDSEWKYPFTMNRMVLESALDWLPVVLLLNVILMVLLALFLGWQLFGTVQPIAQAIGHLASGEAIALAEHGLLGALSADLNRASQILMAQKALLDKRDRTRTQWIAGVSHDIRTPLAIVQADAAQLAADKNLPAASQQKAAQIVGQTKRISQLISDLNLASKLEYQMQPLRLTRLRPAELLRTAAADALNETNRPVELNITIPPECEMLQINGDASLLRRALGNILRNSLIHAPDPLQIDLTLTCQENFCLITLQDNGPGLSEDVRRRLQAPATQLPAHGLGLILVGQILQAHQGSMGMQNITPHGLKVSLYLPLEKR